MNPHISVIIPTHNRPVALGELLEMLVRQSFTDFEVIIVNDCGEPVDHVVSLYPELRIKLLNNARNVKHVKARNSALQEAKGEWIMLCDDDDLILPGHMERMVHESADADLLYSDVEIVAFRMAEDKRVRLPQSRRLFAYELDLPQMRRFSTFVSSGCLYRRSIHDEIGYFDVEMYHYWDWDFFLRVAESYRVKRVPVAGALYAFSMNGDNMSGEPSDMRDHLDRLCEKHHLGELPTKNFFLLLEEPEVMSREAASEIVWDGEPIYSRLAAKINDKK